MVRALPPAFVLFALVAGCGCGGSHPVPTESDMASCSNSIDDDGDGLVDCHDPACSVFIFCGPHDAGTSDASPDSDVDGGPSPDTGVCTTPLDIVLVVDVSTSMASDIAGIRAGIGSIWDHAHAVSSDAHLSLVVFVDDALAIDGQPPFPDGGGCMPFSSAEDLGTQLDRWQMFCATNQSPVSHLQNHDCAENSLDAIMAGVMCPVREGSTRVLVHVTDDTFAQRPAVLSGEWGGGVHVQFNYVEVTTALTDRGFHVGVFGQTGVGDDCGAGRSPDVGQGFASAFQMMPSLTEATGGRFWDLREVRAGHLDVATSIDELIRSVYCTGR